MRRAPARAELACGRAGSRLGFSRVEPRFEKVTTSDGRHLDVMIAGPERAGVVLAHSGTPHGHLSLSVAHYGDVPDDLLSGVS